jgi:hypothetical protein
MGRRRLHFDDGVFGRLPKQATQMQVYPGSVLWELGYYAEGEKPEEFTPTIIGYKYRDGAISIYDEISLVGSNQ